MASPAQCSQINECQLDSFILKTKVFDVISPTTRFFFIIRNESESSRLELYSTRYPVTNTLFDTSTEAYGQCT